MQWMVSTTIACCALMLYACGGGTPAKPKAAASGAAAPTEFAMEDDGTPGWVRRGSGAVVSGGERRFYGVGAASGIKNPSLLRQTADNRARADLGKVFETFSASLMKDYQASTNGQEEQAVEQAIKTLSATSLKGVRIVDHYVGKDGTLFALAELDLQRVKDVVRATEMGAATSYVREVGVEDIFDQRAQKPQAPRGPVARQGPQPGASAPAAPALASESAPTRRGGAAPAWVEGEDPRFPWLQQLCAVGFAPDRQGAENAAYAALARIFEARVASVSEDFMGAYTQTGAAPLEVQTSENRTQVSTRKILSGVRIPETWDDGNGTLFALSCLERGPASRTLREQMQGLDDQAARFLQRAASTDKAGRVAELSKALDAIAAREAMNGELRIIDAAGVGMRGTFSHVDVAAALQDAVDALRVGVVARGPFDGDFRGALIEGLTQRGYDVNEGAPEGMDVLVSAVIRIEDGGKGTGRMARIHFARGVIQVEVKNVAKNAVLATFNESRKEGHRSKAEAERRAVRTLAKRLTNKVGARIDVAMKR